MGEPRIRQATTADAERLAEVYRSAYRENRELGFPAKAGSATAEKVSDWIREHRVYVAEVEEEIVAGVRLEVADRPETAEPLDESDSDCAKLSRLGVHENWKGEGVGSELLDHAEDAVRDWGYNTLLLTTPEEHPYLPDIYRHRGYEQTGTYPLEYREYDEIVMEKSLR